MKSLISRLGTWTSVLLASVALQGCGAIAAVGASIAKSSSEPSSPPEQRPATPDTSEDDQGPQAKFLPMKGAPAFEPVAPELIEAADLDDAEGLPAGLTKKGDDVVVQKDYPTAQEPHRELGLVLARRREKDPSWTEGFKALREEAGKRGANLVVFQGCKPGSDLCAAIAFRLSSATTEGDAPSASPTDAEIVARLREIPGAKVTANARSSDGSPPADPATEKAASEVLAALASDKSSSTAIRNNKALVAALKGMWMGNGSTPFERELLRSMVYIHATDGKPKLTEEGLMMAYTDEKSAEPGTKLVAAPAKKLLELALQKNVGVYLHYEGEGSFFTGLTLDRIREILDEAKKKK